MDNETDLFPAADWGIRVQRGAVPPSLEGPIYVDDDVQATEGAILIDMRSSGRILVTPDTVTLDIADGVALTSIDFYLYGIVPRALRILREEFSLHASCVATSDSRAIAIMGRTMAGKSTTVMGLVDRGYELVIDDVVPVDHLEGSPRVQGWARPVHLRPISAAHFGHDVPDNFRAKVTVASRTESLPLAMLIELVSDPQATEVCVEDLDGMARLGAIVLHSDLSGLSTIEARSRSYFAWATTLAGAVPTYRITRPTADWTLDVILDRVEELCAAARIEDVTE